MDEQGTVGAGCLRGRGEADEEEEYRELKLRNN